MRPPSAAPVMTFQGERDLPLSPAQAWRVLADTDHMNRALGLPAMEPQGPAPADGTPHAVRARLAGWMPVRWQEAPFAWTHERGWEVHREFARGPFRAVVIGAELERRPGGAEGERSRLRVRFTFEPSGPLGRAVVRRLGPRSVASLLGYWDEVLRRRPSVPAEGLPSPGAGPRVDERALAERLRRLAAAPVEAAGVDHLARRLREEGDGRVLRMKPFALAREWGAEPLEVLRLFLHATRAGLLELRWELMCPACRVPKAEVDSLSRLPDRFHCETCGIDYGVDFDRRVELRFSVHPAVRPARDRLHCIGSPARTPHRLAQLPLAPGESRAVELDSAEPLTLGVLGAGDRLRLDPSGGAPVTEHAVRWSGASWLAEGGSRAPAALAYRPGDRLRVENASPGRAVVTLELEAWDPLAATAARVTALQEFRDLFSSEALAPGQEVGVSRTTVLFTDLRASTALYESVGDAPAYGRVHRHFEYLHERVARRDGAIVKTMGDAVMAVFPRLEDGLTAALEIQAGIGGWCAERGLDPPFVLKAGLHEGPVIAVNANERLDYFGRTVNVAARLNRESEGGDVVLLREVWESCADRLDVGAVPCVAFRAELRGIEEQCDLVRLRPAVIVPNGEGAGARAAKA